MKKQFKTTVLALAIFASVAGVFAPEIANAFTGKKQPLYSWQKYTRSGAPTGTPVISATNPFPDCVGNTQICTIGSPLNGGSTQVLRYTPL